MKRVLFVLSSEKFSGGEKVAFDIARNLKEEFNFVFFLPAEPQKEFAEIWKDFKVYSPKGGGILNIIQGLKNTIDLEKPEIIHSHGSRASIFVKIVIISELKKNFKFIYTLHGIHFIRRRFPVNFIFLFWEILTNFLFVDTLTCVSKDDFDLAKKLKLNSENKVVLVENGIDLRDYQIESSNYLRKNFNLKDEIILLTICRLHYQKDVETLIKAMKFLESEKFVLFIVGDGPDRTKLENLTKNLNLENKVRFLGFRREIKEILKSSEIFILSTQWEGLPIVILECWALKIPVIVSRVHGVKCLIEDYQDGILFELRNVEDLAQKIKELAQKSELKEKIVENGYLKLKNFYNIEKMIENYRNIFRLQSLIHQIYQFVP